MDHRSERRAGNRASTAALAFAFAVAGCGDAVVELGYAVERSLPHDASAYTQGLLLHEGAFFESTGRYGESEIRRVDVATGEVLQRRALDDERFGEGLARVGSTLIQLTWKAGEAYVYDVETLTPQRTFEYEGEGWGLCHDGVELFMSDGSGTLQRRDPTTFETIGELRVTRDGFSVRSLNELECVGEHIWANVYMSDRILRIDKATGEVTGELDGVGLATSSGRPGGDRGAVLNGIAYDESTGRFYLTGKLWPRVFEVALAER